MLWGLPQFHKKPKLNHVLTIFWVARITTLANNLCLEHIKPRIQTFPARFLCWRSWTYVFAPFCMDKCIFRKNCFAIWARVDTKFLNLSHHVLPMDGWPGDATFFLWGQPLKIIRRYPAKKRSSPLDCIFDTCALAFSSHLFWFVKLNICVCTLLQGQMYFQKKQLFCNLGARWHKILEFVPSCPIYGWLAWWCDFFPVGPTFEDHPQVFGQKKVQPLGFYFWHLRLDLFKSLFQCL